MRVNWIQSLLWVRQDEGGNSNDPNDPGGLTSRGITNDEYLAWCDLHRSPPLANVTYAGEATIDQIYMDQYWLPYCDPLPKAIDYMYFDMKVNMGQRQATILLQRALSVTQDGWLGVVTLSAALHADARTLIETLSSDKTAFYKELERERPVDVKFDRGWMNRVANVRTRALSLLGA